MLDHQSAGFAEHVWAITARLGCNAPKIADEIMSCAFPLTCSQAEAEGALRIPSKHAFHRNSQKGLN